MSFKCEKGKEMAEFFLTGLDKADLNKIYGIGSKFGKSCKFSFNMTEKAKNSADKAKVVSHGYISITDFDNSNLEQLKKELRDEGVTCEPYNKQEEKSTVKIENFAPNFTDEVDLLNKIKEYKELVNAEVRKQCNFNDSEFTTGIHVDKVGGQNVARATVAFDKKENAIRFYDVITPIASEIFKGFKPIITIRTSYKSETLDNLIGFNIKVPEGKVQEYERDILEALKKINDGIVAASVREIKKKEDAGALNKTSTWMLHITLKSEDDGKELMANYLQGEAKKILQPFFNGEPFLNIFCSAAFRKEFKKAKSNWKPFEKRIKNAQDASKKFDFETRMKAPRFPPAMQPMQFPPYRGPNMPSMGVPPIMPPMGVNPSMMMQFGMANPMVPRPADSEARKQQFLRDKDDPTKNPVTMKKVASSLIIVALEEMNFKDSRKIAGIDLKLIQQLYATPKNLKTCVRTSKTMNFLGRRQSK